MYCSVGYQGKDKFSEVNGSAEFTQNSTQSNKEEIKQ